MRWVGKLATFASLLSLPCVVRAAGPIPDPIVKGNITIGLGTLATGLTSPVDLLPAPDNPNKLLVVDQTGKVNVIQNGVLQSTPFLDYTSRLVSLMPAYDERGLLGMAFSPEYNQVGSPGFHKVYVYASEPANTGTATFTVPDIGASTFDNQGVLSEFTVGATGSIDFSTRRELFRNNHPQFNHNGGQLAFGPDGDLYMGIGDGGNANDVGPGHNATTGNAQDTTRIEGKVLRIDPLGNNSANGQYGIPASNPFANGVGGLPEIYAYGFRNPYRMSFDGNTLLVADVGQDNVEEVDNVKNGQNYGWNTKEGTFLFDKTNGHVSVDTVGHPSLTDPILEYDHDEGIATVGGFVYHGSGIPALDGKYVFGDFSRSFGAPDGRIFYADLSTGQINEFNYAGMSSLGLFVKGFGEDANGEIYLLGSKTLGPAGNTGVVVEILAPSQVRWRWALALYFSAQTPGLRYAEDPDGLTPICRATDPPLRSTLEAASV